MAVSDSRRKGRVEKTVFEGDVWGVGRIGSGCIFFFFFFFFLFYGFGDEVRVPYPTGREEVSQDFCVACGRS
jgi:hypothetical protein